MKQKRWYKESRAGLVAQGCAASPLSSLADFRETGVCSVLTWASCRVRTWSSFYIFIYLASLFQLPIFFAWTLRVGKMAHPHQVLSASLPAPASAQCTQSEKSLYQLLERKGTKQEPSCLCPKYPGMAALPHHKFLLAAFTCLRTELLCTKFCGTEGHVLTREVRFLVAAWVLRS